MNPFSSTAAKLPPKVIDFPEQLGVPEEVFEGVNTNDSFLSELRDFMNDFAATDLNIDSIEEPSKMTKEQANFYIKLYQQVVQEEDEMIALCDMEIDRTIRGIKEFKEKKLQASERKKEYIMSILKDYAASELEGKKTKTIKLPYGSLSFKKQQPKYDYADNEQIILALKEINPEMVTVKTTESINKTLLKKEAIVVGEELRLGDTVIPGITVKEQEQKFEIK